MELNKRLSRRDLLQTGGVTGAVLFLAGCGKESNAKGEKNKEVETVSNLPLYLSASDIDYDANVLGASTEFDEGELKEKEFISVPFKSTAIPTDWTHLPGIAYNNDVDLFLGKFIHGFQTTVWAYSVPVGEERTPEDVTQDISAKIRLEQKTQHEQKTEPMPMEYYGVPSVSLNEEIAGNKNGWEINVNMPNFVAPNYYMKQYGFLENGNAYLFNMNYAFSLDAKDMEDPQKFPVMIQDLKKI